MTEAETLRSRLSRKPIVVAPGVYDPFTAPGQARARRDVVLGQMLAQGMIGHRAFSHAESEAVPAERR